MDKQLEVLRLKEMSRQLGEIADKLLSEFSTSIETLNLSSRCYNALTRADVNSVEQILKMTDEDLLVLRNFGKGCFIELTEKIKSFRKCY